jgi:1A family penicillin-binding protein
MFIGQATIRHITRRLVQLALGAAAACAAVAGYYWATTDLPAPDSLRARAAIGDTRVLDRTGRLIYALPDPLSGSRRPVPLAEIPLALRNATIAVEDSSFYVNSGVDLRGIARAALANARSGAIVAGGSTITQQLARGFLLDPAKAREQSLDRKLREGVLALKLTASYSKDSILALYLNQSYYGGMAFGVEAAARRIFGKPARDLNLAESALIAGLPQAPSRYDPLMNPAAARARQAEVLAAMVRSGAITPAEAQAAAAEPLRFASDSPAAQAPHFVSFVLAQVAEELGPEAVARGGLTITTTLDLGLTAAATEALRHQVAELNMPRPGKPDHQVHNGAIVVLDPSDGAILAMVGSPQFADDANRGQVNGALALRQPGSAIKPLTYAAALEQGWTPATTILDVPARFTTAEGRIYAPQNYDRAYHGPLLLREALATSSNIAAVRTLDALGIPALLDAAQRTGITTLGDEPGRYGLALTLGGGEVTLLELTAAYGAFAAGGVRVEPYAVIAVADASGAIIQQYAAQPPVASFSPQIAYLISDMLSDPYARMRAFGARSVLDLDRPAAVKTGTTTDWRDNWTIGYTPDRVVGVWVGNADGRPMEAVSGISGAGPVWRQVMLLAHRDLPPRAFSQPPGLVRLRICAEGGMLPGENCPATRDELFIAGTEPQRPDTTHIALRIDPARNCVAPAGYPREQTVRRIFRLLPPEAEAWAIDNGVPRPPRITCPAPETSAGAPASPHLAVAGAPALVAPARGAVFAIARGIPPERQQLLIEAAAAEAAHVTILIDGAPVATLAGPPYRTFWQLTPGTHRASLEVRDARGAISRSAPVEFTVIEE